MPLFVCDNCECVENTALGMYWFRSQEKLPEHARGKALCSACAPTHYKDGTPLHKAFKFGKWHGKFDRVKATQEEIAQGQFINRGPGRKF